MIIIIIIIIIIIMIFNLECTSSHPKDHSCKVSLQSDKNNIFSTFMVIMATVAILKYAIINAPLHIPKTFIWSFITIGPRRFFYLSWLSWQSSRYSKHNNNNNNNNDNNIIIIIKIKIIINGIKTISLQTLLEKHT